MRDFIDHTQPPSKMSPHKKRLGGYLVEAGLLTPAQVDVALNDQKLTGMRFGEILAARGWVKQQTIEYLMQKVVLPEQQALEPDQPVHPRRQKSPGNPLGSLEPCTSAAAQVVAAKAAVSEAARQPIRRDGPISKPLPSLPASDGDVSWVG